MIIDDILDMMDDLLDKAATVPLSVKKSIVDCDKIRDCINDIRLNLPQEIKQAKLIVQDRQSIIADANKEAELIIRRAEERAKIIVSNDEITKAAKQKASEMMTQSQTKAKEIRGATNDYIEDILTKTEECLQSNLSEIRKTKQAVRNTAVKK